MGLRNDRSLGRIVGAYFLKLVAVFQVGLQRDSWTGTSLTNAGVFRGFWSLCHGRSYGVQVNVGHAGEKSLFGVQGLGFKAAFPEMAGALIFPVGLPRNRLVQAFHKPAQIRQPLPEGFCVLLHSPKLCSAQFIMIMDRH